MRCVEFVPLIAGYASLASIDLEPSWIAQWVFNVIVAVLLYRLRRNDEVTDSLKKKVELSDEKQHELVAKLVDERFRAMSHEVNNHMQQFLSTIDEMKQRLQEGDGELRVLSERDHGLELKTLNALNDIKLHVVEKAATKEDLKRHEEQVEKKFNELRHELRRSN